MAMNVVVVTEDAVSGKLTDNLKSINGAAYVDTTKGISAITASATTLNYSSSTLR